MPLDAWKNRMLSTTMKDFVDGRLMRWTYGIYYAEGNEVQRYLESAHLLKVSEFLEMKTCLPEGAYKLQESVRYVLGGGVITS